MKTRPLKNYDSTVGCEVYDIDLNSNEEILEFGKLCASQCIVLVDQNISTTRLNDVMIQWGNPSRSPIHNWILEGKLEGRHWREILLSLGYVNKDTKDLAAVSTVSYKKDDKNRPQGLFANGELDWHSDQCAFDDAQRIIGLQSVSDTENSQTTFLCTHDAYEGLSSDMKSMVKELYVKHKWRDNVMAPGLNKVQTLLIHYNMVPLNGMETRLYSETLTGLTGMKLPTHSFDGFVGMSLAESNRVLSILKQAVMKDQYVYTQNWADGQVVFMDQEITLHARPTNVKDGDKRTMARVITYLNHLYPDRQPATGVRFQGKEISHAEFAKLVDIDRLEHFTKEQQGEYTKLEIVT
jgi:alpha-ketoglutarate-dependent taurine dioxygenase